jgi:cytochrome P450
LTPRTLVALGRAAARELVWGTAAVAREIEHWRALAQVIPDPPLREDALHALDNKRAHIDGAALYWTLATRRSTTALRALIAFEVVADYLDNTSERGAHVGMHNGFTLHAALIAALDPTHGVPDYYRFHPWREDGGYLRCLIETCQTLVQELPSYAIVKPLVLRAAEHAQVLAAVNHEPNATRRDNALRTWAQTRYGQRDELASFESTAGASAWLTVLALLAYAADPDGSSGEAQAIYAAYLPWISLAATMLDSYGDVDEDAHAGTHSYIDHYASSDDATACIAEILQRAFTEASALPNSARHVVIAACMVAMYLTAPSVRTAKNATRTRTYVSASGPLTRALLPVLRLWRLGTERRSRHDGERSTVTALRCAHAWRVCSDTTALPPGPPLFSVAQSFAFWRNPHACLAWCCWRYGSRFTLKAAGRPPLVFFSEPDDIRAIVHAPADVLHPGAGAAVIAPLVGEGSFMLADDDDHLAGRRGVVPAFSRSHADEHTEVVRETVEREVDSWPLGEGRGEPVALHPLLRALTLHVILRTVFGSEDDAVRDLHGKLLTMLSMTASVALQEPRLRSVPPWRGIWRRFLAERELVHRSLDALLRDGRAAPDGSALSALLASSTSKRDERYADRVQLREDVMSVILAGHETTAAELAWAFQLLAHDRGVQRELVDDLSAGSERYLTATVYEVLRHRPVFLTCIPRVVNAPYEIGGTQLTPQAHVVGCIHLMHHDPRHYEHPERFDPRRFLDASSPAAVWMPWGGGRKLCPGRHLALAEMRAVLRYVLANFDLLPASSRVETARWRSVIVTPGHGCRVVLQPRRTPVVPLNNGVAPFF